MALLFRHLATGEKFPLQLMQKLVVGLYRRVDDLRESVAQTENEDDRQTIWESSAAEGTMSAALFGRFVLGRKLPVLASVLDQRVDALLGEAITSAS
ncbi:unnamed protein product, partial [Amoebophrya sp. A25]|eukprot:GSA25T00023221001.1